MSGVYSSLASLIYSGLNCRARTFEICERLSRNSRAYNYRSNKDNVIMGFIEKMLNGDNKEVLDSAVGICRGYLNGPWKKITPCDVTVKKLSGGLSNWLYLVRLEKGVASPKQVLLRLYGQTHGADALEALITESVVFTLLSERKLGPKLYGVFPGGRIEEFIPARPLKQAEMSDTTISLQVAEKMAAVHAMNVPISKEPKWMWDTINKWLTSLEEAPIAEDNVIGQKILSKNLRKEAEWLRDHLSKIYSPVVFCHNDLQQGNILIREDTQDTQIVFIDFEYCSYNYRGFDLANHFIEWTYDYNGADYPHFKVNKTNFPSHSQMHMFIERYLNKSRENGGKVKADVNVHSIAREIKHYSLASHFFWGLWSSVNANFSLIPFGYWDYALERMDCYMKLKNDILGKQNGIKEAYPIKRKMVEGDD